MTSRLLSVLTIFGDMRPAIIVLGVIIPWWLAPNGNCQNDLETGDVIEGLPNALKTIHLGGTANHVQNEALLQWFAGQIPSTAINGAYS